MMAWRAGFRRAWWVGWAAYVGSDSGRIAVTGYSNPAKLDPTYEPAYFFPSTLIS